MNKLIFALLAILALGCTQNQTNYATNYTSTNGTNTSTPAVTPLNFSTLTLQQAFDANNTPIACQVYATHNNATVRATLKMLNQMISETLTTTTATGIATSSAVVKNGFTYASTPQYRAYGCTHVKTPASENPQLITPADLQNIKKEVRCQLAEVNPSEFNTPQACTPNELVQKINA